MVKPALERQAHPRKILANILLQYGYIVDVDAFDFEPMAGGFSGTNYHVNLPKGESMCLKICHGYDRHFVESQARVLEFERVCCREEELPRHRDRGVRPC